MGGEGAGALVPRVQGSPSGISDAHSFLQVQAKPVCGSGGCW